MYSFITVLPNYNIEKAKHQICRCLCRAAQRGALLNSYLTSQESGVYKAPPIKQSTSVFYSTALSIIWPMKLDRQQKAEFVFLPCSTEMHALNCKNDTWNPSTAPFKTLQNDWILKPNGNCVRCEKKKSLESIDRKFPFSVFKHPQWVIYTDRIIVLK